MQNPINKNLPKLIHADDLKQIPEGELSAVEVPVIRTSSQKVKGNQRIILVALDGYTQGRESWSIQFATGFSLSNTLTLLKKLVNRGFVATVENRFYVLTAKGEEALRA
jgi:predicted transcriptional regulator